MSLTPHTVRVKTLYRKLLKNTFNWYGFNNNVYVAEAHHLRDQFERFRGVTDQGEIETLIAEGEALFGALRHPDPYKNICSPGGTMFQRNAPYPHHLLSPPPPLPADYDYSQERLY